MIARTQPHLTHYEALVPDHTASRVHFSWIGLPRGGQPYAGHDRKTVRSAMAEPLRPEAKPPLARATAERLQALHHDTDPLELKRQIHRQLGELAWLARQDERGRPSPSGKIILWRSFRAQ